VVVSTVAGREVYRSGNYYPDTLLIYPDKLDCGIPAADGLDNSFRIYSLLSTSEDVALAGIGIGLR
jgi:hypothetical protein